MAELTRYRRRSLLAGGGMVSDPMGQWVHVRDLNIESWALDENDQWEPRRRPTADHPSEHDFVRCETCDNGDEVCFFDGCSAHREYVPMGDAQ